MGRHVFSLNGCDYISPVLNFNRQAAAERLNTSQRCRARLSRGRMETFEAAPEENVSVSTVQEAQNAPSDWLNE